MNPQEVAIKIRGLRKKLGKAQVLDGLDLSVPKGSVTVLLGANGAGKSTLMRCLLGTLRIDAGSLQVLGEAPMRSAGKLRERIGFVPDTPDAEPWMTTRSFFRYLSAFYPTWDHQAAEDACRAWDIPLNVRFRAMSKGQAMKAMMAAALAPKPELILLDEPFNGLDPVASEDVLRALIEGVRDDGATVMMATHDLGMAARIADQVAVLAQGRIVKQGSLDEVTTVEGEDPNQSGESRRVPARLRETLAACMAEPKS